MNDDYNFGRRWNAPGRRRARRFKIAFILMGALVAALLWCMP